MVNVMLRLGSIGLLFLSARRLGVWGLTFSGGMSSEALEKHGSAWTQRYGYIRGSRYQRHD
jgi:hypothetical protein